MPADPPTRDLWSRLRATTPARIGLGRTGDALRVADLLDFQMAHARARDAVHDPLDTEALAQTLAPLPTITVRSAAPDRTTYLRRPDLGRALDPACNAGLSAARGEGSDVVFVLADGLSAVAVAHHGPPVLRACLQRLPGLSIGPIVLATQARVALGDQIGERLAARLVVVLIGERPGLSSADSLGCYLTYAPRTGRRDSERNCVSNIHGNGLSTEAASDTIAWLINQAIIGRLTGVGLKDLREQIAPSQPQLPTAPAQIP